MFKFLFVSVITMLVQACWPYVESVVKYVK